MKTFEALKRFQQKHNLDVTGKVDLKTWKKLNEVAVGNITSQEIINSSELDESKEDVQTTSKKLSEPEENIYLGKNTPNKYSDTTPKSEDPEKEIKPTQATPTPATTKTYLDLILSKYLSYLDVLKNKNTQETNPQTTEPNQFIPQSPNPYFQPAPPAAGGGPGGASMGGMSGPSGFGGTGGGIPQSSPMGNFMQGLQRSLGGNETPYSGPALETSRLTSGDGNGNGFGKVLTTSFGHNKNNSPDSGDNGKPFCDGSCSTRKGGKCEKVVSLKGSLIRKIFGINSGSTSKDLRDLAANRSKFCGKEVEVVNPTTKKCGVYPLYEVGPQEQLTQSMDLTGTIWQEVGGNEKDWMHFRMLKNGDKACEGYTRVDGKST
jgi:hypothetical protein